VAGVAILMGLAGAPAGAAVLRPETLEAWNAYVEHTERRIEAELSTAAPFRVVEALEDEARGAARQTVAAGRVHVRRLSGDRLRGDLPKTRGALIHHWLGAVLVPGATLPQVLAFVQNYDRHAMFFDEVVESRTMERDADRFVVFLKLRRTKVITVTYNTLHDVRYRTHDPARTSSRSVATTIAELADASTPREREKPAGEDRGFLWRLNSYWRFERTAEGVIVECESISLSRDIPTGLGWLVRPFVEGIPRDSLERTLASIRTGVLAARGESPAAFGGRCLPPGCVAPPSNIPDILGRRAWPAGRLTRLGATPDLHHGLLA
jgi:hypothetical protein